MLCPTLVMGRANDVAVVSNDSDFAALFVKVRELAQEANAETVPFLWIHPPDGGALSPEIDEFIPAVFRWDLATTLAAPTAPTPAPVPTVCSPTPKPLPAATRPALPAAAGANPDSTAIAEELIRQLPVGRFKATDAHNVIKRRWQRHPIAAGDTPHFGIFLLNELWPILEKHGVEMPVKSSPRTYEITQAAKDAIAGPSAKSLRQSQSAPEPTAAQLAAAVAASITDDLFSATHALAALKARQPEHPAASYTAQRFGTWFAEQIWPVMEQHGVILAKEKPRRYEMTPDARHRLTALA